MTDSDIIVYLTDFVEEFNAKKMKIVLERFRELSEYQKDAEHERRWRELKNNAQ